MVAEAFVIAGRVPTRVVVVNVEVVVADMTTWGFTPETMESECRQATWNGRRSKRGLIIYGMQEIPVQKREGVREEAHETEISICNPLKGLVH